MVFKGATPTTGAGLLQAQTSWPGHRWLLRVGSGVSLPNLDPSAALTVLYDFGKTTYPLKPHLYNVNNNIPNRIIVKIKEMNI